MITPVISGTLRYQMLTEKYLVQTIECMANVWANDSKTRSISEYFPLARKVCETALKSCLSIIIVDTLCDRVVGFDINLDLMELLELAAEHDGADFGAHTTELGVKAAELGAQAAELGAQAAELGAQAAELGARAAKLGAQAVELGARAVSLGRYDFLTEVHTYYKQHRKLMLRKGEALFHNYVGLSPRYQSEGTWHICLALALEIARSNNFRNVIAITTSSAIADQKVCEQLGFRKIGDLEYLFSLFGKQVMRA
eukprot:Phypoly_transcript_08948.p1 GENE.Phypoly_transcript_08948~~Phypoly_transcript_08948.p1  ORF type:complete len:255 (+),score=41.60 Phypoly_transcript_08948:238-1002(+)